MMVLGYKNLMIKAIILGILAIGESIAKRNENLHLSEDDSNDIDDASEETCVSGYCIDPTYDKLELPSTKPSHIRMNLEVIVIESRKVLKLKLHNI